MNSIDFKRTASSNWNKTNEQPDNNEILEKQRIPYRFPIDEQEYDYIGNFLFHDDALKVDDLLCT